MRIGTFSRINIAVTFATFLLIVISTIWQGINNRQMVTHARQSVALVNTGEALWTASNTLSEYIVKYAETADKRYLDAYDKDLNVNKTRESAIDVLQKNRISADEFVIVQQIKKLSDEIVTMNQAAVELIASGDNDGANEILFGADYLSRLDNMDVAFNQFQSLLSARLVSDTDTIERRSMLLENMSFWSVILFLIVQIIVFFFTRRKITTPIKQLSAAIEDLANGKLDTVLDIKRDNSETGVAAVAYDKVAVTLDRLIKGIERIRHSNTIGNLRDRGNENLLPGAYNEIVKGINGIIDSMRGYLEYLPIPIMVLDKDRKMLYANKTCLALIGKNIDDIQGFRCCDFFDSLHCNTKNCCVDKALKDGKMHSAPNVVKHPSGDIYIDYTGVPIFDEKGDVVAVLEYMFVTTEMVKEHARTEKKSMYQAVEVAKISEQLSLLAQGHLSIRYEVSEPDDDTVSEHQNFKKIADSLNNATGLIKNSVNEISHNLSQMAHKNFDINIEGRYLGDFVSLKTSMEDIVANMNGILSEVNQMSTALRLASEQITHVSLIVSDGSQKQSRAVQDILNSIDQLDKHAAINVENALKASEFTRNSKQNAENSGAKMAQMVLAMESIKKSSDNIIKIIKLIDEISFQTNLLALNASVEAARAGEHGKGFSVVAEEVGSLAGRSNAATKESGDLVEKSMGSVATGVKLVNETRTNLSLIFDQINDTISIVNSISESAEMQKLSIGSISSGINDIADITMQNSAEAENCAAASEELSAQFAILNQKISEFKLKA